MAEFVEFTLRTQDERKITINISHIVRIEPRTDDGTSIMLSTAKAEGSHWIQVTDNYDTVKAEIGFTGHLR